jgi:gliding motility-associated protein GldE
MSLLFFVISAIIILILYSYLRICESAFIRIPSEFIDDIEAPTPPDYRADNFLKQPAPALITFSILKHVFIILLTVSAFQISDLLFAHFTQLAKIAVVISFLFFSVWFFGEALPLLFDNVSALKLFKSCFFILVPFAFIINLLKGILKFSFARYESRIARKDMISISDISDAIENSEVEAEEIMEKQLIQGIVKFGDLEVKEIMRARIDVVSIQIESSFKDVMDKMLEAGYSRYPAFGNSLDDIKGIIYIKDLLDAFRANEKNYNWQQHIRKAMFVPENMKISQLLVEFQSNKTHLAIVVDEYGGTSGIVSLEDVLEEIVGEINDEHDAESDQILAKQIAEDTYIFDAKIPIHDFTRIAKIDKSDLFDEFEGEVESLGGIILSIYGNFPSKNQVIQYKNVEFVVLSMNKHRIGTVKVKINEQKQTL